MEGLEHGDVIALPGQVARAGQARGAGADDSDTVTVGGGLFRSLGAVGVVPVGDKPLQTADAHGVALLAPDAVHLALGLLGAHPAADGGQGGGVRDDLVGRLKVALGNLCDELRDMYHDGAALHAGAVLAV